MAFLPPLASGAEEPSTYEGCSQVLKEAEKAGDRITQKQVASVVMAANPRCLSHTETSEWINEVVFSVIQLRPSDFVEAFSQANTTTKKNVIHILENPINDLIDLQKTYSSIQSVASKESADKQSLLSAVKTAGEKIGLHLK